MPVRPKSSSLSNGQLALAVRDNGIGINPSGTGGTTGTGLANIQSCAEQLGGLSPAIPARQMAPASPGKSQSPNHTAENSDPDAT